MTNIVQMNNKRNTPNDLMTFKEFATKYGTCTSYLYKLVYAGKVTRHKRGYWKISEKEVLNAM